MNDMGSVCLSGVLSHLYNWAVCPVRQCTGQVCSIMCDCWYEGYQVGDGDGGTKRKPYNTVFYRATVILAVGSILCFIT